MGEIINVINQKKDLIHGSGVSIEDVKCAEKTLGIRFDKEYNEYLLTYGMMQFDGREFTGLGKPKRTNVVDVTIELWEKTELIPHTMYVIEAVNIDGLIILQDEQGTIYQMIFGNRPKKLCESYSIYLDL